MLSRYQIGIYFYTSFLPSQILITYDRKINLSRVQLAADFLINSPKPDTFPPPPIEYVSDQPNAYVWQTANLTPLYPDHVITALLSLTSLKSLKLKSCLWLSTDRVNRLIKEAGVHLKRVNFTGSGMQKEVRWAIKGSRQDVQKIVEEIINNRAMVAHEE
jgi:hypothetical protein